MRLVTDESPRGINKSLNASPIEKKEQGGVGYNVPPGSKYTMTVREMAVSGLRMLPQEFAPDDGLKGDFKVPAHLVNNELRFNFPNKGYGIPQSKARRYMDQHMHEKEKIPSPDKYVHNLEFLNPNKKMKIYPFDRKTYIMNTINKSKQTPGVAAYNTTQFDEKFNKPPIKTIVDLKEERYTKFDEINFLQKQLPSFYNVIPIVSYSRYFFFLSFYLNLCFLF